MSMIAGTVDFLKETGALVKNMLLCPVFQHSCIECWNSSFEGKLLYRNICVEIGRGNEWLSVDHLYT